MNNPIVQHLKQLLPELPIRTAAACWDFDVALETLSPDFYNKVLPLHLLLHMEYSILCAELHQDLLYPERVTKASHEARLVAALCLCELLAHVYQHYLLIPREAYALTQQRVLLRSMLVTQGGYSFIREVTAPEHEGSLFSMSQCIRTGTARANWLRVFLGRTNRAMILFGAVSERMPCIQRVITHVEKHYTSPFLTWFGLFFHVPRLLTNMTLFLKHILPGFEENEREASLSFVSRFLAQVQRRWFELGNDTVWTGLSAFNMSIFFGCSVPIFAYLSFAAFAFDAVNAVVRAVVECSRLTMLQQDYQTLLNQTTDEAQREFLRHHLNFIEQRLWFEQQRLGVNSANMTLVFLGMSVALPVLLASNSLLFASALAVLALWFVAYGVVSVVEAKRPPERLDVTPSSNPFRLFAPPKPKDTDDPLVNSDDEIILTPH